MSKIIQMGNMRKESINFRNPQEGRIYSIFGIAPTVMSNSHGTTSGDITQ